MTIFIERLFVYLEKKMSVPETVSAEASCGHTFTPGKTGWALSKKLGQ